MTKRLFIVSNRLPLSYDEEKGLQPASGGLVTAMQSFLTKGSQQYDDVFWVGVPGCIPQKWPEVSKDLEETHFRYLPVFTGRQLYDGYYNGHSNSVLWPLFHYFPSFADYSATAYQQYKDVNHLFAHTLLKHLRNGDTVWIHDYHLLSLPCMLRSELPDLNIGFFLHIPFPSYEIIRLMPRQWQEEMLHGMLGADLIGFHTIDYASHFLQNVQMTLGMEHDRHMIRCKDRLVKVDVFPISIDYEQFNSSHSDHQVVVQREHLRQKRPGQKIIFSVDRLDYTKGVYNRLKAYEYFLASHPEYHERVVFIIVVVPSRDSIPKYLERKNMIDETISSINSRIGNFHWQPVIYQYNSLSFENMLALYTGCDLALITPLRDGMNLVAKEFVASRQDQKGVLVLSEMAGAARELTDALVINPNDIVEMAGMIRYGLEMPVPEQQRRMKKMQERISQYNVVTWAEDFLDELKQIRLKQLEYEVKFLDQYSRLELLDHYRNAKKRLLLLDYDGTLVPFASDPSYAVPPTSLVYLLNQLCTGSNDTYLISGRSSQWLEKWFGHLRLNIIAEYGARFKTKGQHWTSEIVHRSEWKEQVEHIMETYVRRCPQSFIEEKEFSVVWHYRNAHAEQGKLRSAELVSTLNDYVASRDLEVIMGNKIIEVRNNGIDKGAAIKKVLAGNCYDFILAIGDDRTDEEMFRFLSSKENSFTIKVGNEASFAKYNLYTPQMVISLLNSLQHIPETKISEDTNTVPSTEGTVTLI